MKNPKSKTRPAALKQSEGGNPKEVRSSKTEMLRDAPPAFCNLQFAIFNLKLLLALALLSTLSSQLSTAFAQSYSIDWWTIDGGGGTSSGGVYIVSGTIGQPDAGTMSGGNYTLVGGFWGLFAAVQTPGAPYLSVLLTTTNTVCVWWPVSDTSWQLQATTNLVPTGSVWTAYSYTTNGPNCIYIESPAQPSKFYRLQKP